jgi:hypothetical protein
LPGKRSKTRARLTGARAQASYSQRANAILAERDRHLAVIDRLRHGNGSLRAFAAKAHTLLTRGWAPADWRTRADLLKTAAWLLHLERLRDRLG